MTASLTDSLYGKSATRKMLNKGDDYEKSKKLNFVWKKVEGAL